MHRTLLLALFTVIAASSIGVESAAAQSVEVVYREPADAFAILDNVSNWWPGYTEAAYRQYWVDSVGFVAGDSVLIARYARLRERYFDKRGQSSNVPRRDGSGLFTDRAVLSADRVGAAFYSSITLDEAFGRLDAIMAHDDVAFLRSFFQHFRARYAPLVEQTRARTAASRVLTAATLGSSDVRDYLTQVRRFFGVDTIVPFTALYVWWPNTAQTVATPSGQYLLLRVRPAADDTVNSADVVTHEAIHVYSALQVDAQKAALSAAILDRCTVPDGVRRLAVVEEAIATVLGNMEFRRRFQPRRFTWGRRWYGDEWVDMSARLLYPVVTSALTAGGTLDAGVGRDAGALCALLAHARETPSSVRPR